MKILKNVSCEYDRRVVETQLCKLRGTYANFYETVENSPTQGQLNPRKKYDKKWHLGHFFPQQIFFRGSGLVLYYKKSNPTKLSANTLLLGSCCSMMWSPDDLLLRTRKGPLCHLFSINKTLHFASLSPPPYYVCRV